MIDREIASLGFIRGPVPLGSISKKSFHSGSGTRCAIAARWKLSTALSCSFLTLSTTLLWSAAAFAQNNATTPETVTVTGTTIRGEQPVGANLITIDQAQIEATGAQTAEQLLVTVPQLDSFGSAAQGTQNSSDASGTQAPTIHGLGNSASNSTLILIDGHRIPLTGLNHTLADPSIIPTAAISNVEILPDGASAIYGSDAVAGVINFHTRKNYSGWESYLQNGFADHYSSTDFSQLFGHSWDDGGVVAVYSYSNRSDLMNSERDFVTARQDIRLGAANSSLFTGLPAAASYPQLQTVTATQGAGIAGDVAGGLAVPYPSNGGNFQNLTSCPVATISTSTANTVPVFAYPYSTTNSYPRQASAATGPGTGICDTLNGNSLLPSEVRNQGLVSLHQKLGDRLSVSMDILYSSRLGTARDPVGGVTNAAVFSPTGTGDTSFGIAGSAAAMQHVNPFYVGVPGAASTASEFVSMDFTQLLAARGISTGERDKSGQTTAFTTLGFDYDLGGDWLASLGGTLGLDNSFDHTSGSLNSAEALMAINGTTNAGGTAAISPGTSNQVDVYGLNSIVSVTRALTTLNALDVWDPAATNKTSAAVLRSLVDSQVSNNTQDNMEDVTLHADGPLGDFWGAGPIKVAVGGEWTHYTKTIRNTRPNSTGPDSTESLFNVVPMWRTVDSAYVELVVPVIGPNMSVPLVQGLSFDFAGRYDHYNDFGDTANPKIAVNWDIVDGIRASGSFGTSFTAPSLDSTGQPGTGLSTASSVAANNSGAANGLVVLFNDTRPFNGGAGIAGTFVSNPFACAAAGSVPVTDATGNTNATLTGGVWANAAGCRIVNASGSGSQGLTINGGNPNLKPEIGQSYSANLDFDDFGKFWNVLEGLSAKITYYQAKIVGAITNTGVATSATSAGIPKLTSFAPANCVGNVCTPGWAPADPVVQALFSAGKPLSNPLPITIYSIQDITQQNAFNLWQNGIDFSFKYLLQTDNYGDFTFGLNGNQILRASQQNAGQAGVTNTIDGDNGGRFTDIEFTGRASIGWHMDPFTAGLSFNFQHPYNAALTTFPFNLPGPGRLANFEHIHALQTIDLNLAYNLPSDWMWGVASGSALNVSVTNLFNTTPPYEDQSSGFASGNPIGRIVAIALRKKF